MCTHALTPTAFADNVNSAIHDIGSTVYNMIVCQTT